MLRPAAVLTLALLAAACGRETEAPGEGTAAAPSAESPLPAGAPSDSPAAAPAPATVAQTPGAPGPGSYVGRWAVSPELCTGGAWTFAADRLTTAGEVACTFTKVDRSASGWNLAGRCTAEGPPRDATIELEMTDTASPEAMTVSGGPFQSVTLRRCS